MQELPTFVQTLFPKFPPPIDELFPPDKECKTKGIFYKILSKDNEEVGHLLGVTHQANSVMLKLNPEILAVVNKVNKIYFEVVNTPEQAEEHLSDHANSLFDNIDKLSAFIELTLEVFKDSPIMKRLPELILENFDEIPLQNKFILANLIVTMHQWKSVDGVFLARPEGPVLFGLDSLLLSYAQDRNIETKSLEEDTKDRVKPILDMISTFTEKDTIDQLPTSKAEMDEGFKKIEDLFTKIFNAWLEGDSEFFQSHYQELETKKPEYYAAILERDSVMADSIHRALEEKRDDESYLFAIGATHTTELKGSVIDKLRSKGWKIEQV